MSPKVLLGLLYAGYLLSFADRMIFGLAIKPIKTAFHLSDTQLGLLSGLAFALSYAIFSPLGGYIVDRRPRKLVMAAAISFWSAATFATGMAGSFVSLALARIGVGIGESVLHPLSVSLVADTVVPVRRPQAFSVYLSAGAVGSVVALLFGGLLMQELSTIRGLSIPLVGPIAPWQGLFVGAALPGVILAIVVLAVMREPGRGSVSARGGEFSTGVAFIKRYPRVSAAVFAGVSLAQMGSYTIGTWNINFFERVHHWGGPKAAIWLALTSGIANVVGCLAAGPMINFLKRRGHTDAPLRLCLLAAGAHTVFGTLAILAPTPHLAISLFPLASFWGYVPSVSGFTALGEAMPAMVRARLAGLHTFANGVVSNSLGPFLVGFFSDTLFHRSDGLRWAMIWTVCLAGIASIAVVAPGLRQYRDRMSDMQLG